MLTINVSILIHLYIHKEIYRGKEETDSGREIGHVHRILWNIHLIQYLPEISSSQRFKFYLLINDTKYSLT